MILGLANLLIKIFGIDFAKAKRIAWIILGVGALLLFLLVIWLFRSCGGSEPVIDEKQVQENQQEIEQRGNQELQKNLDKSNEVLGNTANAQKQAETNTKEATNKNFTNTNMTEAQKARCAAYPSSAGCPK